MIKPEELTQPGWYLEHFASKDLLVFIPSVKHNCITIQDYDKDIPGLVDEEDYEYRHLKNYAYTYICAPMPLSEFENFYPEYFI